MTETDQSGRLSPNDERRAKRFFNVIGHGEVPIVAHKNVAPVDLSFRHPEVQGPKKETPQEAALRRLSQLSDPYDLLTPETRRQLSKKLEESDKVYRQGVNDAADLPLD